MKHHLYMFESHVQRMRKINHTSDISALCSSDVTYCSLFSNLNVECLMDITLTIFLTGQYVW